MHLFSTHHRIPEPEDKELNRIFNERVRRRINRTPCTLDTHNILMNAPEGDILDVACGHGHFTYALAKTTTERVFGIDIDRSALEFAQATYGDAKNIVFQIGDAHALPPRAVSAVTCHFAFHHLTLDKALDSMAAQVSPGGKLYIKDFCRNLAARGLETQQFSHTGLTPQQMKEIQKGYAAGNVVEAITNAGLIEHKGLHTYLSLQAAYTTREVSQALLERGFSVSIKLHPLECAYAITARKRK